MPSFPLASPESYGVASLQWSARSNDAYARNPWSLDLIKQIFDGRMWEGTLTIVPQSEADGRRLTAWLTALRRSGASAGTFMLGDPSASAPLGSAKDTPGAPVVAGAGQTGEALNVSGLPLNATGYLLAGDYIQLGTGISARLKKVLDDVDSDGSGLAAINLWPPVRTAPTNGGPIKVSGAEGLFVSPSAVSTWQVRPPKIHDGIVIDVAEAVLPGGGFVDIWTIASLFAASEAGAWYEAYDLSTLFQTEDTSTPVTAPSDPVGRVEDKSGNDIHATQVTSSRRLAYEVTPARLTMDKVDDRLQATVPAGGWTGTMVLGTDNGTASYGVTIPAGSLEVGGDGGLYFPGTALVGLLVRDGALSAEDAAKVEAAFVTNGAVASYGAVTNFLNFWRNHTEFTSFPLIDTSAGTNFSAAWRNCSSLTSFPLIDTSAGTNFSAAWRDCISLTSFPLIDTSAGTNFSATWRGCISLTSFPLIDTSAGTTFSSVWRDCTSLTSFPANVFDDVINSNFTNVFSNTALTETSIDNILVSLVASGIAAGLRAFDQSGGSAPSVATGEPAIDTLRARGWTVTVTGGY